MLIRIPTRLKQNKYIRLATCLRFMITGAFLLSNRAESYQSQGFTPKQKAPSLMEGEKGEAEYMLNPEKLDILLHSAAIFTLLEAGFD